jgi:hypothetical protein
LTTSGGVAGTDLGGDTVVCDIEACDKQLRRKKARDLEGAKWAGVPVSVSEYIILLIIFFR